ncbi:IPT/TIG domain-containing protein [Cryobacterium roopkundense]|uniref:IPT/TIG domain-containing protein n=1 Tax=Cryobacterium roopkundense TaxID=1001240 RepID=A0A7W8ZYI8_9MICO|nr:IPT/TIG domain-containing protein [Cryobacterium roopkundense]MBB5642526.1 hypothetical protein [Cryobacterium roopkundense]
MTKSAYFGNTSATPGGAARHKRVEPARGHRVLRFASVVAITALFVGAGAVSAQAAPGDTSNAEGQFLSGSLIDLDLALAASLAGETATSDGTADQTNANNLDLTALGLVNIAVPGGIQVPLDLATAGVVSQYASALADASSVGASGLVSDTGTIGTGITPAPGVAPGPLSLSLSEVVGSLGLSPTLLAEVANLDLTVGAVAGRAAQAAPGAATGTYEIADAQLSFTSPTLAAVSADINTLVAALQTDVNGLSADLTVDIDTLLGGLSPLVSTNITASTPDLAAAVAGLLAVPLTDPAFPGVSIDLSTGTVTVDLDQITALNGLPANTEILTAAVINTITANILGLVTGLTTNVEAALLAAVDAITVTGGATILGIPILTVNTTAAALLAGDTTGITLAGLGLGLGGGLASVVTALAAPITLVTDAVNALSDTVLAPVVANVLPALAPVLDETLTLTVNNQSTTAGVFTETALRVTVLPLANALTLDLGTGRVGVNALAVAATATSLVPDNGPETGGTPVTVNGSGFTGATDLTVDGASVPFVVVDDATITFTTPAHAPGVVPVVVVDVAGNSAPLDFLFTPVTQVTTVVPNTGPEAGANTVTITGVCFTGATSVLFGATPATSFVVVNDTTITAVVPAGVGLVDVTVTGGGTCGTGTLPDAYTYLPAAVITGLVPDNGPEAGGTTVVITGTGFTGATDVTFDGVSAATVVVDSDTQITVTTPAHAPGLVDVVVLSPNGDSAPADFTFTPLPVGLSLTPDNGPETGGTAVTIDGSGFTGASSVTIDGASVPFVVVDDATITFTTPAHLPAVVPVVVTGPGGASAPLDFTFTDVPDPVITGIVPDHGPVAGGTSVVITGTGFTGATAVTFNGTFAPTVTVDSDTQITVITPPHAAGPTNVIVLSPNGNSAPGAFTFDPIPVATSLTPDNGPETGGTPVTIDGSGFTSTTDVTVDGVSVPFVVVDDATITFTTAAHVPGVVPVVVTSPGGASAPLDFTFTDVPDAVITGLVPLSGPETGGTSVVITGTGFSAATDVTFGGTSAATVVVNSDTQITVTTPVHAPGLVNVVVVAPNGNSAPAGFTFIPVPVATSLTPNTGPVTGGTVVTITGTGFTGATAVTIGGVSVPFTFVNDTTITFTTPAHAAGLVPVVVTTPGGASAPLDFTFTPVTDVTTVVPNSGPEAGGTTVTITGVCFTAATVVLFGTTPATSVTVVDDATITAVAPAGLGTVDVTVVGVGTCGSGTLPDGFTYLPVPVATSLAPNTGPVTGGTVVTITGTGFTGTTAVTIDGASVPFTFVNDTTITLTTPAHTAGLVPVVVTTPGGASAPLDFTFTPVTVVTTVDPPSGPATGGTTVTITGSCFTGATDVFFGTTAATSFTVGSDSQITAVSPAGTGVVDVTVVGGGTCGVGTIGGAFSYVAATVVTTAAPAALSSTGFTGLPALGFGILALLLGGAVLLVARRRRDSLS